MCGSPSVTRKARNGTLRSFPLPPPGQTDRPQAAHGGRRRGAGECYGRFRPIFPDEGRNRPPTREKTCSRGSLEERLRGARSLPPLLLITRKPSSVDPVLIPEIPAGSHSSRLVAVWVTGLMLGPQAKVHLRYASVNPAGPGTRPSRQTSRQMACTKEEPRGRMAPGFRFDFRESDQSQTLQTPSSLPPRTRHRQFAMSAVNTVVVPASRQMAVLPMPSVGGRIPRAFDRHGPGGFAAEGAVHEQEGKSSITNSASQATS